MAFQAPLTVHTATSVFPKATLNIPYVSGGPNAAVDHRINETIRRLAQQMINSQGSLDDPRSEMIAF